MPGESKIDDELLTPSFSRIAFYITGHGLGHLTRAAIVIRTLLLRGNHVDIISPADISFVETVLGDKEFKSKLRVLSRTLDSGAVQKDAIRVDAVETLRRYHNSVYMRTQKLLQVEYSYLTASCVTLVVTDCTPLSLVAASNLGIRSCLLTNFTWDFVYASMLAGVEGTLQPREREDFGAMVQQVTLQVSLADSYIQLPGGCPFHPAEVDATRPLVRKLGIVRPAPLVSRLASSLAKAVLARWKQSNLLQSLDQELLRRLETQAEMELGDHKRVFTVVVHFGGMASNYSELRDSFLPPDWICIVLGCNTSLAEEVLRATKTHGGHSRFIIAPVDEYVPDLLLLADCVIGKLGYGTVSECISSLCPLLFIYRVDWPEQQYIEQLLMNGVSVYDQEGNSARDVDQTQREPYPFGFHLPEHDYRAGLWASHLLRALELKKRLIQYKQSLTIPSNPAAAVNTVADMIEEEILAANRERGGLLLLEHININVTDEARAVEFYIGLLGGVKVERPQPSSQPQQQQSHPTLHINMGPLTQFHLPSALSDASVESSQVFRGEITIYYDTSTCKIARAVVKNVLAEAAKKISEGDGTPDANCSAKDRQQATLKCPFGNSVNIVWKAWDEREDCEHKAGNDSVWQGASGTRVGWKRHHHASCGILGVTRLCPRGTAEEIAMFYRRIFGFHVDIEESGSVRACVVKGGPMESQFIRFAEDSSTHLSDVDTEDHIAIYVRDLERVFLRCLAAGLACVNERFPHLDGVEATVESIARFKQFRVRSVTDTLGRHILFQEHEIRSYEHPACPLRRL